eukprot:3864516-Amphidinium_carterae.1
MRTGEKDVRVTDTLFSGDPLTQFFNTVINVIISACTSGKRWWLAEKSIKGDDAVCLHITEEGAADYLESKKWVGVTINDAKTLLERGFVELERCAAGFQACPLRKMGAITFAEPQGDR